MNREARRGPLPGGTSPAATTPGSLAPAAPPAAGSSAVGPLRPGRAAADPPRPGPVAASPARPGAAASPPAAGAAPGKAGAAQRTRRGSGAHPRRPSLGGGTPAQGRELGAQGRQTVRKLLEAGLIEFDERGFQAVRVDDVVRRAKTSHGTFYLYFANKDDLFKALLRDALHDMEIITDEFPVVTSNDAGRDALRAWVRSFGDTYAAHATVLRALSQAELVGEAVWGDGLQLFFRLAEAITQGMTAAAGTGKAGAAGNGGLAEHAELTAVACLMMLERVNYLLSVEVRLPMDEMVDRLSAIIYAAFRSP